MITSIKMPNQEKKLLNVKLIKNVDRDGIRSYVHWRFETDNLYEIMEDLQDLVSRYLPGSNRGFDYYDPYEWDRYININLIISTGKDEHWYNNYFHVCLSQLERDISEDDLYDYEWNLNEDYLYEYVRDELEYLIRRHNEFVSFILIPWEFYYVNC